MWCIIKFLIRSKPQVCLEIPSESLVHNKVADAPIVKITASKTTVTEGQDSLLLTCEV